jgi:membrane-associated protease RseP (regulator of RpoE activity)
MFSHRQRCFSLTFAFSTLAIAAAVSGQPAFAQGGGGFTGGYFRGSSNGNVGYYPYYTTSQGYSGGPGYNIYGNYGVYGYPGSQIEGGYANSGYDPGHGGSPSYGGYGIINSYGSTVPRFGAPPAQRRLLGIDEQPVVLAGGVKAMKVAKVYAGTAAEQAGLKAGDVIRSVNGYLMEQRGNLAWVIANAASDNQLKISVQTAEGSQTRQVSATLR